MDEPSLDTAQCTGVHFCCVHLCFSQDRDVIMVIGAVLIGYASCMLQQGFGPSFFLKGLNLCQLQPPKHPLESESQEQPTKEKPTPIVESDKEEQEAGWPSFGRLIIDLSKFALEALASLFLYFIPFRSNRKSSKSGLTPLKDSLILPEDEPETTPLVQKLRTPAPLPNAGDKYSETKPSKIRSTSFRDPSMSSKHRSLKRQEHVEFYGAGETPPYRSKSQKERTKHRQRDKGGEAAFAGPAAGMEQRPAEMKAVNYDDPKFDHYNMRSKYGDSFRF
ncbi:hypothetical protein U1Q18_000803 [Sarracenia purpurea var. burkii]